MSNVANNINFYTAYKQSVKKKPAFGQTWPAVLPLAALAILLAVAAGVIKLNNAKKAAELERTNAQIAAVQLKQQQTLLLWEQRDTLKGMETTLTDMQLALDMLPEPDEELLNDVIRCAGDRFLIRVYRYDENTRTLEIDAAGGSVNDVPQLVEDLRDTGRFSAVQYKGYTSDTDGVYYCTVGCTLAR